MCGRSAIEGMLNTANTMPTIVASPPRSKTSSGRIGWSVKFWANPKNATRHNPRNGSV